jgi:hypothetical protein
VTSRGAGALRDRPRHEPVPAERTSSETPAWLSIALLAASAVVAASWAFLAIVHVDDRYGLDHVSGARIALARWFDGGTLYPPLYDGTHIGGTRFMPLPIVLHGALAKLTGEYVVSGKVLAYATAIALLVVTIGLLLRLGCPVPFAAALGVVLLTTGTGFWGALNLRADLLPLVLQLGAVRITAERTSTRSTLLAAGLAALAFVAKLSAIWAPIAIVAWLFVRDGRRARRFAAAYVVAVGLLVGVFALWSGGRIFENVFGLSTSGITSLRSLLTAPYRLVQLLVGDEPTAWALVPFAALAVWTAARERQPSIYVFALVASVAVLLVVLLDVGTGWNQLVDPVVLTAIVLGEAVGGSVAARDTGSDVGRRLVGLALVWVLASGFTVTLFPQLQASAGAASYRLDPLAGVATHGTRVLSEDPYVPVSLGQTPLVLDPFMLPRVGRERPAAIRDLVTSIDRRSFDVVVLVEPLDPVDREWWNEEDFGPAVVRAIAASYRFAGRAQGYYLYVPNDADVAG